MKKIISLIICIFMGINLFLTSCIFEDSGACIITNPTEETIECSDSQTEWSCNDNGGEPDLWEGDWYAGKECSDLGY